jgi:hypothetical protein
MTLAERIGRIALPFRLKAQFVFQFFIFVCVARIFGRHPSGTLEAGKLRAPVNSVKSGVAHGDADRLIAWRRRLLCCHGRARATISSGILFLLSLGHARFLFLVKRIFGRDENKISNKVHFFLVDFESDF